MPGEPSSASATSCALHGAAPRRPSASPTGSPEKSSRSISVAMESSMTATPGGAGVLHALIFTAYLSRRCFVWPSFSDSLRRVEGFEASWASRRSFQGRHPRQHGRHRRQANPNERRLTRSTTSRCELVRADRVPQLWSDDYGTRLRHGLSATPSTRPFPKHVACLGGCGKTGSSLACFNHVLHDRGDHSAALCFGCGRRVKSDFDHALGQFEMTSDCTVGRGRGMGLTLTVAACATARPLPARTAPLPMK